MTPSFSFAEKKIVEYKMLGSTGFTYVERCKVLNDQVNDLIANGWVLYKSPIVYGSQAYQAMVKYESEEKGNK